MAYPTSSRPSDLQVANQSFPSFRSDLNLILEHITQNHAGTSRPSYINHGMMWLDTTDSANPILKFYDGTDDITFATFNTSANTVNVSDSSTDVVGDTTPQLGGNLDVNGNDIVSTSNANIDIVPNGTGDVTLQADTVQVGDSNANATITTNGTGDLILNTNAGTNSGSITISDGANGDISVTPNGSGRIVLGTACLPKTNTSSGLTLNFDTHQNFFVTLSSGTNTLAQPSTEASNVGQTGVIIFTQPSSGNAGTLSTHGDYETVGGATLSLSSTNSAYDVVPYIIKADNSILLGTPQLGFS
tara:strand:- start:1898 stop:2803 length:906 start_codon:yes stop_codon:yes gene_type:complete